MGTKALRRDSLFTRVMAVFFSVILVLGLAPTVPRGSVAYAAEGDVIEIATAAELADFRDQVNGIGEYTEANTFEGKTVRLTADIDLSSYTNWIPIGIGNTTVSKQKSFRGTFDGQGHKISGLTIDSTNSDVALFGCIRLATIKNFVVSGTVKTTANRAGGVIAFAQAKNDIINVGSEVDVTTGYSFAGGIIAYCNGNNASNPITITGCYNKGTVGSGEAGTLGGIVGRGQNAAYCIVTSCYNTGNITATGNNIGGIAGQSATVKNCVNIGTISSSSTTAGPVFGSSGTVSADDPNYWLEGSKSGYSATDANISITEKQLSGEEVLDDEDASLILEALNANHADVWKDGPSLAWEPQAIDDATAKERVDAIVANYNGGYALRPRYANGELNIGSIVLNDAKRAGLEIDGVTIAVKSADEEGFYADNGDINFHKDDSLSPSGMNSTNVGTVLTVKCGSYTKDTNERNVTIGWDVPYVEGKYATELDSIGWNTIKGENGEQTELVSKDLTLPQITASGAYSAWGKVTWSSDSDVVTIEAGDQFDGITTPKVGKLNPAVEDTEVALTATMCVNPSILNTNVEQPADFTPVTKTFTFTVEGTHIYPPTAEELLVILQAYYNNPDVPAGLITYSESGDAPDFSAITGDLQLPTYTRIKDAENNLVFANREITVASENPAITVSSYRANVDKGVSEPTSGDLVISFTRPYPDGETAVMRIPTTVVPAIDDEALDAMIADLEKVEAAYWDGINDNLYADKDSVTGTLHPFQGARVDSEGNVTFVYTNSEVLASDITSVGYFGEGQSVEMEAAGYNTYKSSDPTLVQHENLVITAQTEDSATVTISSMLGNKKMATLYKLHPENEKLARLAGEEVSVDITVLGTKQIALREAIEALPAVDAVTGEDTEAIAAAREAYNALTALDKSLVPQGLTDKLDALEAALGLGEAPEFADTTLVARVGEPFELSITAKGTPTPKFALAEGATLPAGVELASSGAITGTLSELGSVSFDVTASNGLDPDATATVTINVVPKYDTASGTVYYTYGKYGVPATSAGSVSGVPLVHVPVDLAELSEIDLDDYGMGSLAADYDGNGSYDITQLHLFIYVNSLYSDGVVSVNMAESNFVGTGPNAWGGVSINKYDNISNPYMTYATNGVGLMTTASENVLSDGDEIQVNIRQGFNWPDDSDADHFFINSAGDVTYNTNAFVDSPTTFTLKEVRWDMGGNYVDQPVGAGYEVKWGADVTTALGTATTDANGQVQITFPDEGTYYVWADGEKGVADGNTDKVVGNPAAMTVDVSPAGELADGTYAVKVTTDFGMFGLEEDALLIVNGDDVTLVVVSNTTPDGAGAPKYDVIANNIKRSDIGDATPSEVDTIAGYPIYGDAETEDAVYWNGIGNVVDYQFNIPLTAEYLKGVLTDDSEKDVWLTAAYTEHYTNSSGSSALAGKWSGSKDNSITFASVPEKLSDSTEVPVPELPTEPEIVEGIIDHLPDPADVTEDDIDQIIAAENALNFLSDEDKAKVSDEAKAKLDAVKAALPTVIQRIAGENYANETAAAISQEAFEASDYVVLARDDDFADALGATGLAGVLRAPIVLTDRTQLSAAAADEINRLGATDVYIIGGTGAMKEQLEADLEAKCGIGKDNVKRLWGEDSYDTSLACAKEIVELGGDPNVTIIAMSTNFQDALSMSSYAYKYGVPVVLQTWGKTSADRGFTDEAKAFLADRAVLVAGGAGAISNESIAPYEFIDRLWGETGYDTSEAIAKWMVEKGYLDPTYTVVTCGAQAPKGVDALAGAALGGLKSAPMLLVNTQTNMEGADTTTVDGFLTDNKDAVKHLYVLGGTYVMPADLYTQMQELIGAKDITA